MVYYIEGGMAGPPPCVAKCLIQQRDADLVSLNRFDLGGTTSDPGHSQFPVVPA
jgi:hypothetical protein